MKYLALVAFAVVLAVVAARPEEKAYTSRFDNVDIDQILKTDRLFRNYFNCLMEKGKCTPDGKELKRLLPDALKTDCLKCTTKQREGVDKVLRHMLEKRPTEWEELKKKYDPENLYTDKYQKQAEDRGIKI